MSLSTRLFSPARNALFEFFVIVLGVLVALAVDSWQQDREEKERLRGHLISLVGEIDSNLFTIGVIGEWVIPRKIDRLGRLVTLLEGTEAAPEIDRALVDDLLASTSDAQVWFQRNSYDTLINSGGFRHLDDAILERYLSSAFNAAQTLLQQPLRARGNYASVIHGILPTRAAAESHPMLGYLWDEQSPPVYDDGMEPDRVAEALFDARAVIIPLARNELAYATGTWIALARMKSDFVNIRKQLLEHPLMEGADVAPIYEHPLTEDTDKTANSASADTPTETGPAIVELRAVGTTFEGPREISSGWTTFRFVNHSSMTHFAIIDVPPEGISPEQVSTELMGPFQLLMDALNAGDDSAADAALGTFPPWIGELARNGGPGLLSPGLTGQTTVYLAPGEYLIECYVKFEGIFHSTSPAPGQLGMLLPLTVTARANGAPEPNHDATLVVRNSGFELAAGQLRAGPNTIRVDVLEQQALPSFVGNDVHLIRVTSPDSVSLADAWMDWRTPDGLQDPAPVEFLGGVQDLPAGMHGYFSVDLSPGDYAFVAEMPGPSASGFVLPFSINP